MNRHSGAELDAKYPTSTKCLFSIPTFKSTGIDSKNNNEVTYLCGNSLGLMPKSVTKYVNDELKAWADEGVLGHHKRFDGRDPWVCNEDRVAERLANLVFGCLPSEVSFGSTLTTSLNSLVQAFYRPKDGRYKIMCESKAFPSDMYCFQNQVRLQGYEIDDALILLEPRPSETFIRTEDILDLINKNKDSLALVALPAIQFYTGQYFDIQTITKATKEAGSVSGWDLAHASGNVPLHLHDWQVDFAVFCSYKYLNCGAGNLGGFFVHDETSKRMENEPRPAGWWAVDLKTRFEMNFEFKPALGARGFSQSNVSFFGPACMNASLDVFEIAGGVSKLTERREMLRKYMVDSLKASEFYNSKFVIMTEGLPDSEVGCQVSLLFKIDYMDKIVTKLTEYGVIGDERRPNVLRWAATPLYNTFSDVEHAVQSLNKAFKEVEI